MPLLGNYNVLSKSPGRALAGSTVSGDRSAFNKPGAARNIFTAPGWSRYAALPLGHAPGGAWVLAISAGYIAARFEASFQMTTAVVLGTVSPITGNTTATFTASATSFAIGALSGSVTPFTTLSPENLAASVWNALTADYVLTGSFGAALGSGVTLNLQDVRDAMKLAPSPGAPATGSIDQDLDKIRNLAGLIPAVL